ncbi:LysR family transcriptional regulator [Nonlabens ulvanivorans]|uniref:RuBisCO operon transcriptional regulator n=1 Tax=Nonlabens ulvanivorans TaxID=906888 RepID=A0A090QF03_NONUL|nr:LysR family transcriptional regulator [Nonlabens ulvanivorans]GAL01705.1 RuBisCO operon transcriptional regulator [Nonlabens ulvanivorans]
MHYTLHQLEIFFKISQLKSITKAAEELNLTQPAVSIQLKKFQDQFPLPLTEYLGRKIHITEFGKEIADTAENILEQVATITYKSAAYEGKIAGKLNISVVSTGKYVMPYFLSDFLKKYPGIDLTMNVTNKSEVIKSIEDNTVDFAMVSVLPDHLKISRIELMRNELFLLGKDNPSKSGMQMSTQEFKKLKLIYREKGSATRQAMESFLDQQKFTNHKKIELVSNEAVKQAVIAGLGYSIMPIIGIKNELKNKEVQIIPIKNLPIITNWNLIWLSSKKQSPAALALAQYVKENKIEIIKKHFSWMESKSFLP